MSFTLGEFPPWFLRAFAVVMGLLWGSFLNVVIHRVPLELSVVSPGSTCPSCKQPIRAWHNIPVLSYLLLGGKSACCKLRISPRYPLVELMGGVLSLAVVELLVLSLPGKTALLPAFAIYVTSFALALNLIALAFIDLEHMLLPLPMTIGGAVVGFVTASLRGRSFEESALGALLGFLIVWLPFDFLYRKLRGKTGMAMGDAFLVMLAGAWFGWKGVLFCLFAGALQGTLVILPLMLFGGKLEDPEAVRKEREEIQKEIDALPEPERSEALREWQASDPVAAEGGTGLQARLPFGPFLCVAVLELLLFDRHLEDLFYLLVNA